MIKISELKKSYKSNNVLKGVNLSIKKGEIKALIGMNGAGKSTLVEILTGVKKYDEGEILINNLNIKDRNNKKALNQIIGYMPQSFSFFNDLTVYENLGYICSLYSIPKEKIGKIIDLCYLTPHKDKVAGKLSGGFRQLLSLATVLIHSPEIFVLDEPTSAMDPIFRRKFWEIIRNFNKSGVTIILITHYIEELLECNTFAMLGDGVIKYDGKVDNFKKEGFINIEDILNKYSMEK